MKPARLLPAVALLSLSLLLWEIILTRLYSVLLLYYFTFIVISLVMLGLTVGAIWVSVKKIDDSRLEATLGNQAFQTTIGMVAGTIILIVLRSWLPSLTVFPRMVILLALSAYPFLAAGKFLCLALTRGQDVGKIYAADLFGAGVSCLFVGALLFYFGGPGAAFLAAIPAAAASALLTEGAKRKISGLLAVAAFACAAFGAAHMSTSAHLFSSAGYPRLLPLFERWNNFSRVTVFNYPVRFNWGISPSLEDKIPPIEQLQMETDCGAMTPLMRFDGRLEPFAYLKHDITAFAHFLRPQSKVLIIGPGGGRDILAALVFGQPEIQATEINPAVVEAVNGPFGDFTGHLDRLPQVKFFSQEGRNFVERSRQTFGVIQLALIDTWSASAAGAYAFVENGLYTVESWKTLLEHLTPNGILSLTRWYYGVEGWPVHTYRACVLGLASLRAMGVPSPERCVIVLRLLRTDPKRTMVGTILISRQPFTENDISTLENQCRESACEIAYSWKTSADPVLSLLMESTDEANMVDSFPLDISATTDDRPYFQFHDKFSTLFGSSSEKRSEASNAGRLLKKLVIGVALLTIILIALPPLLASHKRGPRPNGWRLFAVYFFFIGIGYFLVELALIQRFGIFLGHPSYGFVVILFSLLVSSALGSFTSQTIGFKPWIPLTLVPFLIFFPALTKPLLGLAVEAGTVTRIFMSVGFVAVIGLLMGFFLPMGLRLARNHGPELTGWYWSINSAASVLGSVLGVTSLIAWGEARTLWVAAALYLSAGVLLLLFSRSSER